MAQTNVQNLAGPPDGQLRSIAVSAPKADQRDGVADRDTPYRAIFELTSEATTVLDLQGRYVEQNAAHRALLGYSDEELLGRTPAVHMDPPVFLSIFPELVARGEWQGEVTSRRRDGSEVVVHLSARAVRDGDDRPICYVGIKHDVSLARKTEESNARLAALVESSEDAIIGKTLDGIVTSWNPGAQRIFGYSAEEMIGQSITRLLPADRSEEEGRILAKLRRGERIEHFETLRVTKDGRTLNISVTSSPIRDARGRIVGAAKIARDITDRVRGEEALRRLNETLEVRVAQRTAEADRRAEQLRALASELSQTEQRERRRLATLLHDDLAQVLAISRMKLSLVPVPPAAQGPGAAALDESKASIAEAIRVTRAIMHDLSPPMLYDLGLSAALDGLAERLATLHRLRVHVDVRSEPSLGDDLRTFIFAAARELLMNIIKYAGVEEAFLTLDVDDGSVRLRVEDRGAGFNASALAWRPTEGGGFGLFNVRERLELLGGKLEIDSAPGKGTRVTLSAPLPTASAVAAAEPSPAPVPSPAGLDGVPAAASDGQARVRVLLVDDHKILRDGIAGLLREQPDLEVVGEAPDGLVALELTELLQPDVVIMDVSMPRMNGIDATRRLRAEMPQVQVVGLSMHEERDMQALRDAGAVGYVTKGAPAEQLIAAIRTAAAAASASR